MDATHQDRNCESCIFSHLGYVFSDNEKEHFGYNAFSTEVNFDPNWQIRLLAADSNFQNRNNYRYWDDFVI